MPLDVICNGGLSAAIVDVNLGAEPSFKIARALQDAGTPFAFMTGYDQSAIPPEFAEVARIEKPRELRHIVRAVAALQEAVDAWRS
jgi:uncharacterized lipoprotein YbaY